MSGINWGKRLTWSKGKQNLIKQDATGDNLIAADTVVDKPPRYLPEDVQIAIATFLTDKEIIKMIGASRLFYHMAMVRLFRNTDTYWTEFSLSALIRRLEDPSAAALVEEFTYCVSKQQPLQSDARRMRQILPLMHNVHTLSFTKMNYCPSFLILAALHSWSSHLQNLIIDGSFTVKCLQKSTPVSETCIPNLKLIWRVREQKAEEVITALAKFICQFRRTLRSLSFEIWHHTLPRSTAVDVSTLMSQLGTFHALESFAIAGNYSVSNIPLAQQFLLRNHRTLKTCHFDKNAHLQPGFGTGFQWVNVLNRETCSPSISDLAVQLSDSGDTEYFLRFLQDVRPQLKCLAATGYYLQVSQVKQLCQCLGTPEVPSQLESLTLFLHDFPPLALDLFARSLPYLKQLRIFCFSVRGDDCIDPDLYQTIRKRKPQKAFAEDLNKYNFLKWELQRLIVFTPSLKPFRPFKDFSNLSDDLNFSCRTALECSIPSLKAAG